ncbi:GSCFA domain-containing protein [Mesorhizobium sp. LHD-90]|uniref:GSCFA domain-containing protein n=1 Tax=Mesorhizobium sp. LHD-90 TaxID=3071414 RepID=UPI0027E20FA3|nr:GSCFA domain-containing protein [Mesorhizobium sp. LHD-90]MDQ6437585.1 GSCFA domain-containing protein [Mesorhizobium sp. LHD-90]
MNDDQINAAPVKSEAVPVNAPIQKIQARLKPNSRWSSHHLNKLMTVPIKPIFGPDDVVFTMGSCFAERIRISLTEQKVKVGPPLQSVPTDAERYKIDSLPTRPHMNYYNSFTIRQEFERHIGEWRQDENDYWTLPKDHLWQSGGPIYQDPYRRAVFGRTPAHLRRAVSLIDNAIDEGIGEASVFFITLGMAEVFRNKRSGLIACQKPGYAGGAGEDETEFHMSSYEENLDNMSKVVEIISRVRPGVRIVVTVSPVGLSRTFGNQDILVANTEGKSILRGALGALERKYANVTYFPSYEIVMANSPVSFREDDGRHVANWVVSRIVSTFRAAHFDESFGAIKTAAE